MISYLGRAIHVKKINLMGLRVVTYTGQIAI